MFFFVIWILIIVFVFVFFVIKSSIPTFEPNFLVRNKNAAAEPWKCDILVKQFILNEVVKFCTFSWAFSWSCWCFLVLAVLSRTAFLLDFVFCCCWWIQQINFQVWCVLRYNVINVIHSLHIVCTRCPLLHSYTYAPNQSCHSLKRN